MERMERRTKCQVLWYGETWVCRDQLQNYRLPKNLEECFLVGCPGRGPIPEHVKNYVKPDPVPPKVTLPLTNALEEEVKDETICSYFNCSKPRATGRKYCGDVCRKRFARREYKKRQKEKRLNAKSNSSDSSNST